MGVQSTIDITRKEAENKWIEKRLENYRETLKAVARAQTDDDLAELIEEHFYNYRIVENS